MQFFTIVENHMSAIFLECLNAENFYCPFFPPEDGNLQCLSHRVILSVILLFLFRRKRINHIISIMMKPWKTKLQPLSLLKKIHEGFSLVENKILLLFESTALNRWLLSIIVVVKLAQHPKVVMCLCNQQFCFSLLYKCNKRKLMLESRVQGHI